MKIVSWNVNGLRAILKKDFIKSVQSMDPDILSLQETKANSEQVKTALSLLEGYNIYANGAKVTKGYSGTTILSKTQPISIDYDMKIPEHDKEGRVITSEFPDFYLVNVYVPNSGNQLVRLDYRKKWDQDFLAYLRQLQNHKPVIVCGDFNVAHQPIDIARPKANYNKNAGYTQTEIDGFNAFLNEGYIDTFRHFYPDQVKYTWWSYRANARSKNIGWRIDYCLISKNFLDNLQDAFIKNEIMGSDHCPLGIHLSTSQPR